MNMKKVMPWSLVGVGVIFIIVSQVLKNGGSDADFAVTNLFTLFMLIAGAICIVVGAVTFFLRHEDDVW